MSKKKSVAKKAAKKAVKKTSSKVAKKVIKKAPAKAAKKAAKKVAKKAAGKAAKKVAPVAKKVAKKAAPVAKATKKVSKKAVDKESKEKNEATEATKKIVLSKRKRKSTPAIFKIKSRKATPILFTLDDVKEIISKRKSEEAAAEPKEKKKVAKKVVSKSIIKDVKPAKSSVHSAASVMDILGFNPKKEVPNYADDSKVPAKWKKYYKSLMEMRSHLRDGLDLHTKETLHRSSKDDAGDLSNYGQHMADAGTDNFDRDFALSVVSSEQEALQEIEEAIGRIMDGTYGICEITGKPIKKERLTAVPFTKYSLEGRRELETNPRRKDTRVGAFGTFDGDDVVPLSDDDS